MRAIAALMLSLASACALAQAWPAKPVQVIISFTPASATDIVGRIVTAKLSEIWGQPVINENRSGAGGAIGSAVVAKAAPDGYTLLINSNAHAVNPAIYAKLPYEVKKDFTPVLSTAIAPLFLIVNAAAPYKTVAEFVEYGKSNPKGLTFGSPGVGSAPHLTAELLMRAAGGKGVVIQFRGDAPAYNELLAGRIDATLTAITTARPDSRI